MPKGWLKPLQILSFWCDVMWCDVLISPNSSFFHFFCVLVAKIWFWIKWWSMVLEFLELFELFWNFFEAWNTLAKRIFLCVVLKFLLNSKVLTKFGPLRHRKTLKISEEFFFFLQLYWAWCWLFLWSCFKEIINIKLNKNHKSRSLYHLFLYEFF